MSTFRPLTIGKPDGAAPSGWRWALLKDVARLESGHTPSRRHPEWWHGDVPWISLNDIRQHDGTVIQSTIEQTNEAGLANSSARLLPKDTIVLSRTASVGFVTRMGRPMATSQDFVNWVCGEQLLPEYLMWVLIASRNVIRDASSGAIHKTVYMPTVESFGIFYPPLPAQRRIAAKLEAGMGAAARARAAAHARLEAADQLLAATVRDFFDRHAEGEDQKIGALLRLRNEIVHPYEKPVGPAVFVGLEHIERDTGRRIGSVPVEMSELTGRKPQFFTGDIVYGYLRPYLNKVWVAEFDGLCSVDQYVYEPRRDLVDTTYVSWFMRSPQFLQRASASATPGQLPRIGKGEVASAAIALPPLDRQKELAAMLQRQLHQIARIRETAAAELAAVEALPGALLREAFVG